ncbi:MAG: helix-turn-helix transcriptional regulator [Gammaproteobacteria bacterium]|nr:MAG: helix-turn-helix transcriptional regulator [Gammaproteobacteria bacterium]
MFALRAGFDRTFPSLLEGGLRTLTAFCTIANALEVSPTELLTDTLANFGKSGGPQPLG